ncbi:MAG TPA: carboxypeptidase-like regulatory domain-containing protein [Burkholderiales bacterium]|nr:carboxypeptidase-like regulatory domain-containing protein [Burkholderiales bacterium]
MRIITNRIIARSFILAFLVATTGCGGGGDDSNPTGELAINTPATGFTTTAPSVVVSGIADMANSLDPLVDAEITWSTSAGNFGVANRSSFTIFPLGIPAYSWDAQVPLAFGDNTIDVKFLGDSQSIIVTRFAQVNVFGAVSLATTAAAVSGVTVSLALSPPSGGANRRVTDQSGGYMFVGVRAGNYTVSPEAPPRPQSPFCFTYNPPNTTIDIQDTDTADKQVDFIATPQSPCYSISGRIVASNNPTFGMPDIPVRLTDLLGTTLTRVTNASGIYTFDQLTPGTYTVSPSGFANFNPTSTTATITNTNIVLPNIARLF